MDGNLDSVTTVEKEMGITHRDFYKDLPNLLNGIPYLQDDDTLKVRGYIGMSLLGRTTTWKRADVQAR